MLYQAKRHNTLVHDNFCSISSHEREEKTESETTTSGKIVNAHTTKSPKRKLRLCKAQLMQRSMQPYCCKGECSCKRVEENHRGRALSQVLPPRRSFIRHRNFIFREFRPSYRVSRFASLKRMTSDIVTSDRCPHSE